MPAERLIVRIVDALFTCFHGLKWATSGQEGLFFAALVEEIDGAEAGSLLFIAGLSMGGFGALRIGAKYSGRFLGISGHSSITCLEQMKLFVEEDLMGYAQEHKVDEDWLSTFPQYRGSLPPIRFDCGIDDSLIEYNRELHRKMVKQEIPHE